MKVLVTGGAGLIGMAVRAALQARGHGVVAIDITDFGRNDHDLIITGLNDRTRLQALIRTHGIEAIFHCGAISGPMLAQGQPMLLVNANIVGTATLLDIARDEGVRRFVFCSSISVYGDVGAAAITEATPLRPTSVYGATKVACEQLIQGFAAEYGLDGVSLRIGRVYGAYRRANCHLATMIRDAEAGRATAISCDPAFVYHYVYVEDVADAMIAVLEAPSLAAREYNVGAGEGLTMPEIAKRASSVLPGLEVALVPGVDDVPDVQTLFDVSRIARDVGWRPNFDLATGLADYQRKMPTNVAVA